MVVLPKTGWNEREREEEGGEFIYIERERASSKKKGAVKIVP